MFGRSSRRPAGAAVVAAAPFAQYPTVPPNSQYTPGWAPFAPGATDNVQVGRYAGRMLTQIGCMLPGVQLRCGVEGLRSNWYYPPVSAIPLGSIQMTQRPAVTPGPQLVGSRYTGPVGPLNVKQMQQRISVAQIRQTGAQAAEWARGLSNTYAETLNPTQPQ